MSLAGCARCAALGARGWGARCAAAGRGRASTAVTHPAPDRVEEIAQGDLQIPLRRLQKEASASAVRAENSGERLHQLVVVIHVDPSEGRHQIVQICHGGPPVALYACPLSTPRPSPCSAALGSSRHGRAATSSRGIALAPRAPVGGARFLLPRKESSLAGARMLRRKAERVLL